MALLGIVALVLIGKSLTRTSLSLEDSAGTEARMERLSEALVNHVSLNRRLPCPASGTANTGEETFAGTTASCTSLDGVVPWKALGIGRDEALDGWGRQVSYRVFAGASGFTQPNGLNVTDCNSNLLAVGTTSLDAGQLCKANHENTRGAFIAAKGGMLSVIDRGSNQSNLAFVLISHGPSGNGAFGADSATREQSPPSTGSEFTNTRPFVPSAPFRIEPRSAPGVTPAEVAHFDDVVVYKTFDEVVAKARVTARDWGIDPANLTTSATTFNAAAVAAAGGNTSGPNTGTNMLTFGTGASAVTIFSFGGTNRDISTGGTSGEGIGAIQQGSGVAAQAPLSSAGDGDALLLLFGTRSKSLGMTLVDFGTISGDPERLEIYFYQSWTGMVNGPHRRSACRADNVKANFQFQPDTAFGEFDYAFLFPSSRVSLTSPSEFFLGATRACAGDICPPPNAMVTDNCYRVTPNSGPNGTISPSTVVSVGHELQTAFTVTPLTGYSSLVTGTCGGRLNATTFTTAKIASECTVDATFFATP